MSVDFGLPQSSAAAQAKVDNASPGTVFTLPAGYARFNVNLSRRPDLSFVGPQVGGTGSLGAAQRFGTWIRPESAGKPVFTVAPSELSQVGPQFHNLYGYMPDSATDLIYVRNCNNGVIHNCENMYGRFVAHADGGEDNAWWDCRNLRSYGGTGVTRFNANQGWSVVGLVHFRAGEGQAGAWFDGYAQLNNITHAYVDGTYDASVKTGYGFVFQGGAHHNSASVGKCEATLGALFLPNADTSGPATRANSVDLMTFSARSSPSTQVDIRAGVEQTYIGRGCSYVGTGPAPISNRGTGSDIPSTLRIS